MKKIYRKKVKSLSKKSKKKKNIIFLIFIINYILSYNKYSLFKHFGKNIVLFFKILKKCVLNLVFQKKKKKQKKKNR